MTKAIWKFDYKCVECGEFRIENPKRKPSTTNNPNQSHKGMCTKCKKRVNVVYGHYLHKATPLDTK